MQNYKIEYREEKLEHFDSPPSVANCRLWGPTLELAEEAEENAQERFAPNSCNETLPLAHKMDETLMANSGETTALLQAAARGSHTASRKLIDLIHRDLKHVARARMANEQSNHTLQPTAVINEVFLRLFHPADQDSNEWLLNSIDVQSRSHFLSIAAGQMRLLLIDHARAKKAAKRDFGVRIPIEDLNQAATVFTPEMDVEELDKHLKALAIRDARAAKVVEMKFFGGMTDKDVAALLNVSFATVRRDWEFARKFLKLRMQSREKAQ